MLHAIAENFKKNHEKIEKFFKNKTEDLLPPLYLSCDIRNSGRKLGVIDTNLFPAGFNNLCNAYSRKTITAFKAYFERYYPKAKKIILLVEEHTRNRFYLDNIKKLNSFLQSAGLETRLAYWGQEIDTPNFEVMLSDGSSLSLEKLNVQNGVPQMKGFEADLVISNNDFSQSPPEFLQAIANKIIPNPALGWHKRRKNKHFEILAKVIEDFASTLGLDPWLLGALFDVVENIDFSKNEDLKRMTQQVEILFERIQAYYQRFEISESPYVFIKNNAGTYGMGITDIMQPEEILQMNRRIRNKLLSSKGGQKAESFLIQEGIPTADFYSGVPIEPVIYMVGFEVVGGFFRMNSERDAMTSLNTRGMIFSCLCLHKIDEPHEERFLNCAEKSSLVELSSVMARLAALAAALEMKQAQA